MISSLSDLFLTWVIAYGAPVFAGVLLVGGIGVPLPVSFLLIAAGAFVRLGMVDAVSVMVFGFAAVVIGDSLSYGIGRWLGGRLPLRLKESKTWGSAEAVFARRGGLAILLTRSVLSSMALPTNLIAGSSGYRFRAFLAYDVLGEAIWFGLYGGLGYLFGSQWEYINDFLSDFGGLIAGVVVLAVGGYYGLRWLRGSQVKPQPTTSASEAELHLLPGDAVEN